MFNNILRKMSEQIKHVFFFFQMIVLYKTTKTGRLQPKDMSSCGNVSSRLRILSFWSYFFKHHSHKRIENVNIHLPVPGSG